MFAQLHYLIKHALVEILVGGIELTNSQKLHTCTIV